MDGLLREQIMTIQQVTPGFYPGNQLQVREAHFPAVEATVIATHALAKSENCSGKVFRISKVHWYEQVSCCLNANGFIVTDIILCSLTRYAKQSTQANASLLRREFKVKQHCLLEDDNYFSLSFSSKDSRQTSFQFNEAVRAFQELLNFYLSEWFEYNKIPTGYAGLDLSQSTLIGEGTFGTVYSGIEVGKTNRSIVIKLMRPLSSSWIFEHEADVMNFLQRHGVENVAEVLMAISPFNAVGLPKSPVALVMPYYGVPLYRVLDECPSFCFRNVCSVAFCLLKTLTHLKKLQVSHNDFSASNVAVDKKFKATMIDWAAAERVPAAIKEPKVTVWYRAPECLIQQREHDEAVDMWSFGCLMVEMILKKPAFPALDEKDAISLLISELGMPSHDFISSGQKSTQYFNKEGLHYQFLESRKDSIGKKGSILCMTREGVKR